MLPSLIIPRNDYLDKLKPFINQSIIKVFIGLLYTGGRIQSVWKS